MDAGGFDAVDVMLEQWRSERPDLDLSGVGILGRVAQLSAVLAGAVEPVFARHGLRSGEFDVLTALRRSGPPYVLIPSALSETLMMSRAGMTSRLDRLEAAGLVRRSLDPDDRRSFHVALTEAGHEVVDAVIAEHATNVAGLVSCLDPGQRQSLDQALRTLLDHVAKRQ
ncbi:MarR family winged helix-turn-helix transcriptional regulator [Rugosimonospora africana]|uniref:MarR family transcriptional regulator n=1 Tax=Rugosimonospora africana TaxID=556532 RepID=A0A8J3VT32_9ACTN|nr:MarR family transcriptional regulator [Rugosimonospora africana]GIH17231.1 MarR family transcriptional regulator [Rugosimonospora africana]